MTDASGGTLAELAAMEPLFHRPGRHVSRAEFEAQTDPDFWETGASGRRYSREDCWRVIVERPVAPADAPGGHDFRCQAIGAHTYLLTYTLDQPGRVTRRLTVWQRRPHGWVAMYHQGTIVAPAPGEPGTPAPA